ncbi:MAG: hypothetical protein P4M11_14155 [Candidatus Pacebacteria bacterium]|nr:hypothetical protein [Candidatus Paceibacterota bacterium]
MNPDAVAVEKLLKEATELITRVPVELMVAEVVPKLHHDSPVVDEKERIDAKYWAETGTIVYVPFKIGRKCRSPIYDI